MTDSRITTDRELEKFMNELARRILDLGEELRPHDIQMTVSVGGRGLGNPHNLRGEVIVGLTVVPGRVDPVHQRVSQPGDSPPQVPIPEE